MKSFIRISFLALILILIVSCFPAKKGVGANNQIVPLSDTITNIQTGVVYALPRSVFTVYVEMERIIEKPGPYSKYAGDLLGLKDVIQNAGEFWSMQYITVKSHVETDPSEYYVIKSNSVYLTNILSLKKEGLIMDLNPEAFDKIHTKMGSKESEADMDGLFDLGSDEYFQVQRDTAYKRVNIDSLFIRIPYIVEKKRQLSTEQMAERAARKLMEMREGKHLILTGEATVFPQSSAPIAEMNKMEKEYTELFVGKRWKETKIYTYQLIPQKDMTGKPFSLFRFSELTGPMNNAEKGGTAVNVQITPEQKTKDLSIVGKNTGDGSMPLYDKLYYRVPDVVNVKISTGKETLYESRKLVYQYGEIIQLPVNYLIGK